MQYYESPTIEYKLSFGNQYADYRYAESIAKLYPRSRFRVDLERDGGEQWLSAQPCVYLLGSSLERFGGQHLGWLSIAVEYVKLIAKTPAGLALYEFQRPLTGPR